MFVKSMLRHAGVIAPGHTCARYGSYKNSFLWQKAQQDVFELIPGVNESAGVFGFFFHEATISEDWLCCQCPSLPLQKQGMFLQGSFLLVAVAGNTYCR